MWSVGRQGNLEMIELKLTYGKNQDGQLVHVDDVPSGLACDCTCSYCGGELVACKGNVRKHYFRHYLLKECKGAFESQLHLISKHIIEQNKAVMLPSYQGRYDTDNAHQLQFTEVFLECAQDDLQPDLLCKYVDTNNNEHTLWVEILYTHEVDEIKTKKIKEREIECIEIDVSHLFADSNVIDEDILTDFLLNQTDNRRWINNVSCDNRWLNMADIVRTMDIVEYLAYMSDDENNINDFQKTIYALFDTGYLLKQEDYDDFYRTLKKYQYNIRSQEKWLQNRYLSALQMLLCHLSIEGKQKGTDKSKEELLYISAFARDYFEKNLDYWVKYVLSFGTSNYVFQVSPNYKQEREQYASFIKTKRKELQSIVDRWKKEGTKELADKVIFHIENPYQDNISVLHIEEYLVPNKDYLSFLLNTPKNEHTLDVYYAIFRYNSKFGISVRKADKQKIETHLNELLTKPNPSKEDNILIEGLMLLKELIK